MKELCPVPLNFKALCFWKMVIGDEALRDLTQNVLPLKKNEALKWPGYSALELVDCRIDFTGCAHISQALRTDIPLQVLTLDFNPIGDQGIATLAEGLRLSLDPLPPPCNRHVALEMSRVCSVGSFFLIIGCVSQV